MEHIKEGDLVYLGKFKSVPYSDVVVPKYETRPFYQKFVYSFDQEKKEAYLVLLHGSKSHIQLSNELDERVKHKIQSGFTIMGGCDIITHNGEIVDVDFNFGSKHTVAVDKTNDQLIEVSANDMEIIKETISSIAPTQHFLSREEGKSGASRISEVTYHVRKDGKIEIMANKFIAEKARDLIESHSSGSSSSGSSHNSFKKKQTIKWG